MLEKYQSDPDKETADGALDDDNSHTFTTVDDTEVILRRKCPGAEKNKQRLGVVSCPDETYLHNLCCDGNFKMLDLRRIREENDVNPSSNCRENKPSVVVTNLENSR